ncbi:MAG: hypothetical protein FWG26_05950 [Betaproteobacteria bacterium]|jgi:hypothetical protein|nr:hypothetical protein [Betaproteobacteria bacterium]
MTEIEMDRFRAEIQKLFDDAARSRAEAAKFQAEATKIMTEQKWYPIAIGAGLFGAIAAFVKLFL